ncbi:hypothetical protein GCM10010335_67450 [Streptomyces galbus]|nr:hypothetical protein GCM10010335_67450 [Streptomyces galbus]
MGRRIGGHDDGGSAFGDRARRVWTDGDCPSRSSLQNVVTAVTMQGMAKTQLGARVDEDVAELARKRAADLGLSIGDYLARLVQDDTSGLRARAVDAAARFLAEHQSVFDDAENAQKAPRGAHAA